MEGDLYVYSVLINIQGQTPVFFASIQPDAKHFSDHLFERFEEKKILSIKPLGKREALPSDGDREYALVAARENNTPPWYRT